MTTNVTKSAEEFFESQRLCNERDVAWRILHAIDPEWDQDAIMDYLMKNFFDKRYHKHGKTLNYVDVNDFGSGKLCYRVDCSRCDTTVKVTALYCRNAEWSEYQVCVLGEPIYISFVVSRKYLAQITIDRSNVPVCWKLQAFT